jgi:hypothetical protein
MFQYLTPGAGSGDTPPKGFDPRVLDDTLFPLDRVFCLVGTNAKDYEAAAGLSRGVVGPESDGLVQIEQAQVPGAHRAFVHRSHSGRYGIVNSEEGYQNLQRFLFGDVKVVASLVGIDLAGAGAKTYYAEVRAAVRQLPVLINEQRVDHFCAVRLEAIAAKTYRLFSGFLIPKYSATGDFTCRYVIRLAIFSLSGKVGDVELATHLEGVPLWADDLVVELTAPPDENAVYSGRWSWQSTSTEDAGSPSFPFSNRLDLQPGVGQYNYVADVLLPERAQDRFGVEARVRFEAADWE